MTGGSPRLLLPSLGRFLNSVDAFHLLTPDFAIQNKEHRLHPGCGNCAVYCSFSVFTK